MSYCTQCGSQLPENASFCPDCGQSANGQNSEALSLATTGGLLQFFIETQGISQDWKSADGSYDSVSRGSMTQTQLTDALNQVLTLKEPDYSSGDFCPPALYIQGPHGSLSLALDMGTYFCSELDQHSMSVAEAMAYVTGQKKIPAPEPAPQLQATGGQQSAKPKKPSFFRRFFAFVIGGGLILFGLLLAFGFYLDKQTGAAVAVGIIIPVAGWFLSRVILRRGSGSYNDSTGTAMGMGHHDHWMDDDDDYDSGGDFDGD